MGSFSGGDIGRTELGLICTWVERGRGEMFQKEAQQEQRPRDGICELGVGGDEAGRVSWGSDHQDLGCQLKFIT